MNRSLRNALVLLTLLTLPVWVYAQQGPHQHDPTASSDGKAEVKPVPEGTKPHGMAGKHPCKEMMARHDKMVEAMKAMDARLEEKLAAVKAGKNTEEKLAALEAALVEMSAQRKQIHGLMGDMHHAGMMCGRMKGGMGHGKRGNMKCPMMGGHGGEHESMRAGDHMGMMCCAMMEGHSGHGSHSSDPSPGETGIKQ